MRSKLNFLINVSLKKKIKSKWFLIANLIIALLLIGIVNIDSIITAFGGDFNNEIKIYVIDETNTIYDGFKTNLAYYSESLYSDDGETFNVVKTEETKERLKEKVEEESSLILEIYYDKEQNTNAKLISLSTIDTYDYQLIASALNSTITMNTISELNLSEAEYNKIVNGVEIEREILDENMTSEDEDVEMVMTTVFPILILPFFMLTIFLVQMIGSEVNDEKTTKSMEIIISNVSPKTHFFAKIISNNLFIFFQAILVFIYGAIGLFVRNIIGGNSIINGVGSEISSVIKTITTGPLGDKLVLIIILTLIQMILTFIAYSLIAGILASMTTNSEDYQQVQIPIVVVLLLGYYLAIMAGMFKGSILIKICSFIPFISAILSPSLLVLGQIGLVEVIISILIMIFTLYILIKYGLRIYKVGILNYSSSGLWKKIFRSVRNK